ncbi:MAG: chloride channel protein [Cytophagales bacterium]
MLENETLISLLKNFTKWLLFSLLVSFFVGSASAGFLLSLDTITSLRIQNSYLVFFLPLAGLCIVAYYFYFGKDIEKGTNLVIENCIHNSGTIPLKISPAILCSTLLTHLFGGSAGREGTAVIMSGGITDYLSKYFKFDNKTLIYKCAIAAGFSSVFGTPIAGIFFALEVCIVGNINLKYTAPILFCSLGADWVTSHVWSVTHTHYSISQLNFSVYTFVKLIVLGILFGLFARFYTFLNTYILELFKTYFKNVFTRVVVGSLSITTVIYCFDLHAFSGLSLDFLAAAFVTQQNLSVAVFKTFLTIVTLSCGFKGGEVTPLFVIGACLGSFLSGYLGISTDIAAALGFVAIFSGASKTPLTCTIMGIELFGAPLGIALLLTSFISFYCSGNKSIYSSQIKAQ